ncbi:unnamed protein product, partial [Vitis vinifera]
MVGRIVISAVDWVVHHIWFSDIAVALSSIFIFSSILHRLTNKGPMLWPVMGIIPTVFFHMNDIYNWGTRVLIRAGGTFYYRGMFKNFPKGNYYRERFNDLLGGGIFNADDESWKEQRRLATFEMHSGPFVAHSFQTIQGLVHQKLLKLIEKLAKSGDSTESTLFRFIVPPFVWKPMRFFRVGTEKRLKEAVRILHLSWARHELLEELKKMVYLQAALTESLRLYPSVPIDFKEVMEDDVFPDGTPIKRGARVLYSIFSMARIESIWGKDCMEFKPERWIKDGELVSENQFKYPVFNAGPRLCIGKKFAYMQMKMVAASILMRYSVKVVEGHNVIPKMTTTLYMKNGLLVTFKPSCSSGRKTNGRTSSFALVLYNIYELMNFTHQVCTYNVKFN